MILNLKPRTMAFAALSPVGEKVDLAARQGGDGNRARHHNGLDVEAMGFVNFLVDADPERQLDKGPRRRVDAHPFRGLGRNDQETSQR